MSTGYECVFVNLTDSKEWFYVLQRGDCPVGAWDWMEYADCYGPFRDQEQTNDHLREWQANPGGYSVWPLTNAQMERQREGVLASLVHAARRHSLDEVRRPAYR